ncbi:MAG: GcrA family cell cycle regulator [Bradyrhizobium sp.]
MEPVNWASEHSDALREYIARGVSFSEAAKRINATFKTTYTRNAALGRARRLGIAVPERPKAAVPGTSAPPKKVQEPHGAEMQPARPQARAAPFDRVVTPTLCCVEVDPRHLVLIELENGDCRYPYGGDEEGEAITFCGHPRRPGSSYCTPHFHLSRNPAEPVERDASETWLRIIEAA